ncbi:MAG: hypothetical protein M1814_006804 [Vezdaea aestivalis]|nr:MAG: hypothetical protein M1814_006804 [Vezdaea aestivalis]
MADFRTISAALSSRPALESAVSQAIAQSPQTAPLFTSLAEYILEIQGANTNTGQLPAVKKRRLDVNGTASVSTLNDQWPDDSTLVLSIPDVSFVLPQRKKYALELLANGVRGRNAGGLVEVGIQWKDIAYIILTPQPDKATPSFYLTILPSSSGKSRVSAGDAIVLSLPDAVPKSINPSSAANTIDTFITLLPRVISPYKPVTAADTSTFKSAAPQPGRKGPALHAKAFRGSKEGSLFFLDSGILWGFKKPLFFAPLDEILGVAYTSILQRTFNLVVTIPKSSAENDGEVEEVEFSMIDQIDFPSISGFIADRNVQDGSLAASRRAKASNINPPTEGIDENETTELERAQREIEAAEDDAEDEEEEDYDPGSEGESEGEGNTSEDEGVGVAEAGSGEIDDDDGEEDLISVELGSQAESVNGASEKSATKPSGAFAKRKLPNR